MESLTGKKYNLEDTKDNLLPKCILCNQVPELGIKDGFFLLGQFVCSKCEEKILTLSYHDPTYNAMVQQLKDVIYNRKKRS